MTLFSDFHDVIKSWCLVYKMYIGIYVYDQLTGVNKSSSFSKVYLYLCVCCGSGGGMRGTKGKGQKLAREGLMEVLRNFF